MTLRNPQYTGENRCWPCTVVNVALVALVAGGVALAGDDLVAAVVVVVGVAAIGLRGYAVPGTPQLTARFPEPVLALFGKTAPAAPDADAAAGGRALLESDSAGIRLADPVRDEYESRASELVADRDRLEAAVRETFDGVEEVSVNRALGGDENWFAKDSDGNLVQKWSARPVVAMDVAGEELLATSRPEWGAVDPESRREERALLRRGARTCPDCGTTFESQSGSSVVCCGGRSLVGTLRCPECSYAVVDANDLPADESQSSAPASVGR